MRFGVLSAVLGAAAAGCQGPSDGNAAPVGGTDRPSDTSPATSTPQTGGMTGSSGADDSSGDAPPACPAPDPITTVDGLVHRGRAESGTFIEILDLEARGELVYGCTATQGMMTWDVSNDAGTLVSARIGPPGVSNRQFPRCQHVALDAEGRRAAITNRGDEVQPQPWLHVYNVEDREEPIALRGWTGDASIEGVVWDGDRIFAAAHTAGVLVFEDTGGEVLEQVGSFADDASDAWLPVFAGGLLYVAEGATGVRVYDVSGDDPVLLSTLALGGSSRDLVLDDDALYVAASSSVVRLDVTDPSVPAVAAQAPAAGTSVAIALGANGLVYSAEWDEVRAYEPNELTRVWSEVVPTGDDFSRVLTLAPHPEMPRLYAGEWTGMHMFESQARATGPEIAAAPASVQFGRIEAGDTEDRVVVVRNEGDQPLNVYGYTTERDTVSVDDACFTVDPGGVHALELRFAPDSDDVTSGSLLLQTDDPDEPEYELRFNGNAAGADIGDPMPDFMLQDIDGNDWTRADLEGKVVLLAYFATF
ncbi:MAG: hypothetical protein ACRBN8_05120 [Nannocystales bacterium]